MNLSYSLPTLDISNLREECLADTGLKLSKDFVNDVLDYELLCEWELKKFAHREYGESRDWGNKNAIDPNSLDTRTIVRQKQSSLKQEMWMGNIGRVEERANKVSEALFQLLGDNSKYFTRIFLLKFNSDQGFIPHKDGGGYSRLYIPIYPFGEDYARLEFYYNNDIYYLYNYISPPPVYLFNSQAIHAVFNQGYPPRVNLQVNCMLPYKEALELFSENISK